MSIAPIGWSVDARIAPHRRSATQARRRNPSPRQADALETGTLGEGGGGQLVSGERYSSRRRAVLDQSRELNGVELVDAWLERCTLGDRRGSASQTDLLAVLGIGDELAVMGVEAKVTETFGQLVSEWIGNGSEGKEDRL